MIKPKVVGLLGFGEVGSALWQALVSRGNGVIIWDIGFSDEGSTAARRLVKSVGANQAVSAADLALKADVVISAVTAGSAVEALRNCEFDRQRGCFYLDLNSVSPNTKCELADLATSMGAHFVEAAVMSPINPSVLASPILLGGPKAETFLPLGQELGFSSLSIASSKVGRAAATKMCRSVLIKGMEALVTEAMVAASYYDVTDDVLASLGNLLPRDDWPEFAHYMMTRSIEHGIRRSEEMHQAAITVRDAGLVPVMTESCAQRQAMNAHFQSVISDQDLYAFTNNLLAHLKAAQSEENL